MNIKIMKNILNILKGFIKLFELAKYRNVEFIILIFLIFLTTSLEFLAISLVQPLTSLASGEKIVNLSEKTYLINSLFEKLNIASFDIYQLGFLLIVTLSLSFISTILLLYRSISLSVVLRKDWTKKILSNLLSSPYASIAKERSGKLIETISNETKIGGEIILTLIQLIEKLFLSTLLIAGMLISNFYVTLGILLFAFFILFFLKYVGVFKSVQRGRKIIKYNQSIASIIAESINNIRQIKLLNAYEYPLKKIDKDLKKYGNTQVAYGVSKGIPTSFFKYLFITGGVVSLMYISSRGQDEITNALPSLTLIALLAGRLSTVFSSLSKQVMKFNLGLANIESVHSRVFSNYVIENLSDGLPVSKKIEKIIFENASYSWLKNDFIIKDLNIVFEKGVNVLTGPSGCGKSTIAALLLSLVKLDKGKIKINNKDIKTFNVNSLRSKIAYVTQENEFFNGTFSENIKLGNPLADEKEVISAAKLSSSHHFILSTENGYQTELSERGVSLSGGQKQRLSLSRALIKKHDVYIFDEVTNALDSNNEKIIQKIIQELGKENIVIQISHLPNAIKNADKLFKFDKSGKVKIIFQNFKESF